MAMPAPSSPLALPEQALARSRGALPGQVRLQASPEQALARSPGALPLLARMQASLEWAPPWPAWMSVWMPELEREPAALQASHLDAKIPSACVRYV